MIDQSTDLLLSIPFYFNVVQANCPRFLWVVLGVEVIKLMQCGLYPTVKPIWK